MNFSETGIQNKTYLSLLLPRVNYDTTTWGQIGEQLTTDHLAIPALQRATIICDVADLARTGYVSEVMMVTMEFIMTMMMRVQRSSVMLPTLPGLDMFRG